VISTGPAWLADTLAAAMIATAAYCASRIVFARLRRRRTEQDLDAVHVAMGLAMAGMFVPRLDVLPGGTGGKDTWTAVFCVGAAWFAARAWQAARSGTRRQAAHHVPHLVACAAMVYMFLAPIGGSTAGGSGGMSGMGGGGAAVRFPTLGLALTVFLVGSAVIVADRITLAGASASPAALSASGGSGGGCAPLPAGSAEATQPVAGRSGVSGGVIAPRASTCCHIAMSVAMAYMLVVLL
jgi:hypothetical protein